MHPILKRRSRLVLYLAVWIVFGLLLLQSSLNEVFNPRLRRGRRARKTTATIEPESDEPIMPEEEVEPVGAAGMLETPVSTGREHR